jgi:hypothetical protein
MKFVDRDGELSSYFYGSNFFLSKIIIIPCKYIFIGPSFSKITSCHALVISNRGRIIDRLLKKKKKKEIKSEHAIAKRLNVALQCKSKAKESIEAMRKCHG